MGATRKTPKGGFRGRRARPRDLDAIEPLLGAKPWRRDLLIEYLHRIQDAHGCLHVDHLTALAECLRLSLTEVYEVATFYHHFDVVRGNEAPPAPVTLRVCDSVTCAMAGADKLIEELESAVPADVRIQRVPCVGRCDAAPVAVLGQHPLAPADRTGVEALIAAGNTAPEPLSARSFADYCADGGYALLRDCHNNKHSADDIITLLSESGLRGLGGAGFPAGRKWSILKEQPAPKYLAVNIDEGEPGTFKDRYYMERDPHRFIEGMLIAAWATGLEACYIYLRDEYAACRELLQTELAALQAAAPVPLPLIELRRGAGAYICGEESAMIESIEGKRGMPRLRPPYVAEVGLFGRPTLEHNMETLHWVRDIVEKGPAWFTGNGRRERHGLRSFSVSGRVRNPGVKVAPAGISVRELIDEYCGGMADGHEFYAYFPGGASGGILPARLGDVALDFDTLQEYGCFIGSAAVIVLSRADSVRRAALNAMRFFEHESCGQCTPCRVGTGKAAALMEQPRWDTGLLEDLARSMEDASICGLGQAAPNPLRCAIKYFPEEFESGE